MVFAALLGQEVSLIKYYRRSGNFRCYNIFVNVRAYENLTHEYFLTTAYLSRLFVGSRSQWRTSPADTQLSFKSLHRNFTPVKNFS